MVAMYTYKRLRFNPAVMKAKWKCKMINSDNELQYLRQKRKTDALEATAKVNRKKARIARREQSKKAATLKLEQKRKSNARRAALICKLATIGLCLTSGKGRGKISDLSSYLLP